MKIMKLINQLLYKPCHDSIKILPSSGFMGIQGLFDISIRAGWYMIECQTDHFCICEFTFDQFSSVNFELPIYKSGIFKRILFFENDISCLRFSIRNSAEANNICYLRFIPLRRSFAIKKVLSRIQASEEKVRQLAIYRKQNFDDFILDVYDSYFLTDENVQYQRWITYQESVQFDIYAKKFRFTPDSDKSEFILFCAPGYQLVPEAKSIMMSALYSKPDALLVYADEDRIDHKGLRIKPQFKPAWNPDLFLSRDYVSSFYMCRRSWYDCNRDVFDRYGTHLTLRYLLPTLDVHRIMHIPLVLAHADNDEVLDETLSMAPDVTPCFTAVQSRTHYSASDPLPRISLLVPTRDSLDILKSCVQSILSTTTYARYEILILDNQSRQPETLQWFLEIQQHPQVTVIQYNRPFNYSAINNFGVKHAKGSIIGLINNDIEVISPDWLTEMVSHACRPEIGCVGAKLYYSDGRIQHAGVILSSHNIAMHGHRFFDGDADGYQGRLKLVQNYSAVTGACLVVRKEIYEQVGGLNEEHLAVAYNDVDFCLKVREAGYRNLWTPYAELYHHESMSRGSDDTQKKRKRLKKEAAYMRKRWGKELANDPCYNPNLTPLKEDFSLRVI